MGAIGHPGDIERLRMAAIELASTEGFTRSAADVSLRRLAFYSLSPVLKSAFEQVYGAPYLARMIFAEVGPKPADDLFLRVEYDGAIAASGSVADMPAAAVQRDQRNSTWDRADGGVAASGSRSQLHSESRLKSRARCLECGKHGGARRGRSEKCRPRKRFASVATKHCEARRSKPGCWNEPARARFVTAGLQMRNCKD